MPLQSPPTDLDGFPERAAAATPGEVYRMYWHRDRVTGDVNSPWRFASIPPGASRFDLPAPEGTCYWSDRRYGAFLEVFRGATLIDMADVKARRLWRGTPPAMRLADVLADAAYQYGVNAAISTQPDYAKPQEWAEALRNEGFEGLIGTCSHDPKSKALNVAVFGNAGAPPDQPGWTVTAGAVETDGDLLRELASFNIYIEPVPFDVAVSPPPA